MESTIKELRNELEQCFDTITSQAETIKTLQSLTKTMASSMYDFTRKIDMTKMSLGYSSRKAMRARHVQLIDEAAEAYAYNVKYVKTLQNELSSGKTDLAS